MTSFLALEKKLNSRMSRAESSSSNVVFPSSVKFASRIRSVMQTSNYWLASSLFESVKPFDRRANDSTRVKYFDAVIIHTQRVTSNLLLARSRVNVGAQRSAEHWAQEIGDVHVFAVSLSSCNGNDRLVIIVCSRSSGGAAAVAEVPEARHAGQRSVTHGNRRRRRWSDQ